MLCYYSVTFVHRHQVHPDIPIERMLCRRSLNFAQHITKSIKAYIPVSINRKKREMQLLYADNVAFIQVELINLSCGGKWKSVFGLNSAACSRYFCMTLCTFAFGLPKLVCAFSAPTSRWVPNLGIIWSVTLNAMHSCKWKSNLTCDHSCSHDIFTTVKRKRCVQRLSKNIFTLESELFNATIIATMIKASTKVSNHNE